MKDWLKPFIYPMVLMLLIATIGLLIIAGVNTYKGVMIIIEGKAFTEIHSGAGLYFILSMDLILGTIVTIVLMVGIVSLFEIVDKKKIQTLPEWIHINDFKHLKILVWETILVAMVVFFFGVLFNAHGHYEWEILVIPISILLLAVGVYFVKKK